MLPRSRDHVTAKQMEIYSWEVYVYKYIIVSVKPIVP